MTVSAFHSIAQVTLVLALTVGLIFSLGWLAKRTQGFGLQGGKHITLLQTLPLGQKEKAVLIELNGSKILLGVTGNQINTLWVSSPMDLEASSNAADAIDSSKTNVGGSEKLPMDFSNYLKAFLSKNVLSKDVAC